MENQINYLDKFRTQVDDIKKEIEDYKSQSDKKYQEQLNVLLVKQTEEKDAHILRLEDVIRNLETKQALTVQEHEREIFQMKQEHSSLVNHIKDELSFLQQTYRIEKQELEHKCNTLHTEREIIAQHLQTQQRDLSTTSQTIQSLQRKVESSMEKEKKLQVDNDQLVQENLRLAKSVSEQNQNYKSLEENLLAVEGKYQQLDREYKETKQKMRTDQDTIKNLEEEIVKLSGHSNSKQKIQYYASVKKDLMQLKAEREKLSRELVAKDQYIKKMTMEDKKKRK
jgi:chromosome segregation ATPase